MKKLLLIPTLILTLGAYAQMDQGHWITESTGFTPVSSGVREIVPVDSNVLWLFCYDGDPNTGGIFRNDYSKSTDGGRTWTVGYTPANPGTYDWASLCAINADTAWAMSFNSVFNHGGLIYRTYNGGTSWDTIGTNIFTNTIDGFPNNIYFWNKDEGIICGDPDGSLEYEIYRTMDGGNSWQKVDTANIPNPQDVDEAAWTNHFQVIGDTVWFDTNEGRVYRSTDRGQHWTVAHTTLAVLPGQTPQQAIDIAFANGSYGLARYYDDGAVTNTLVRTTDGGMTWDTLQYTGNLFGGDFAAVPGTNTFISTGISSTSSFIGTSYSTDGGATWVTVETGVQRGALAISDSIHMWCGGFTTSPTVGGVFRWELSPYMACSDLSITPGTASSVDSTVCDGDTITFDVTGFVGPNDGYYSGLVWMLSTVDISGSTDPITSAGASGISFVLKIPANASNSSQLFINDGNAIDGSTTFPYGLWYATPVFFGNAVNANPAAAPTFAFDLTLDANCIYTGNSVPFTVYAPNDPNCGVGVNEVEKSVLNMSAFMQDVNTLNVKINSLNSGKAFIQIMDLTGRSVFNTTTSVNSGSNTKSINVGSLATGTYIIKATVNGNEITSKVVKF